MLHFIKHENHLHIDEEKRPRKAGVLNTLFIVQHEFLLTNLPLECRISLVLHNTI